jgi:hypothetical protein
MQHFKTYGWILIVLCIVTIGNGIYGFMTIDRTMAEAMEKVKAGMPAPTQPGTQPGVPGAPPAPGMTNPSAQMPSTDAIVGMAKAAAIGGLVVMFALCAFGIISGALLVAAKPAGRVMGIIAAILSLFNFPFGLLIPVGTAAGIYGLWTLFHSGAAEEWDEYVNGPKQPPVAPGGYPQNPQYPQNPPSPPPPPAKPLV